MVDMAFGLHLDCIWTAWVGLPSAVSAKKKLITVCASVFVGVF